MLRSHAIAVGAVAAVAVIASGCAPGGAVSRGPGLGPINEALVLRSPPPPPSWELSRNDEALGVGRDPGLDQVSLVEVYGLDHRRTVNGRVTETSRTVVRTLRQGRVRGR